MKKQHIPPTLQFRQIINDSHKQSSIQLIKYKQIISKALPKMDKQHIVKLLFDKRHCSLIGYQDNKMIGGACYIRFENVKFVQLAFLAVRSENRSKGYGRVIMNKLKSVLQGLGIQYIVTYGDITAAGFFKKQGFSQKITLETQVWDGLIKHYDGGTLMQCKINQKMDYLNVDKIIKMQKQFVIQRIKQLSLNAIKFTKKELQDNQTAINFQRKTLQGNIQYFKRDPRTVPGVIEAGWTWQQHDQLKKFELEPFKTRCNKLIQTIKRQPNAKYFLFPVQKQVQDYYQVIKNPMDLYTISIKIKDDEYRDQEHICQDIQLIFNNCKQFNHPQSIYYKSAAQLQITIKPMIDAFKKAIINTGKS